MVVHVFIKLFTISISECELGPYVKFIAATRHSLQAGNTLREVLLCETLSLWNGFIQYYLLSVHTGITRETRHIGAFETLTHKRTLWCKLVQPTGSSIQACGINIEQRDSPCAL